MIHGLIKKQLTLTVSNAFGPIDIKTVVDSSIQFIWLETKSKTHARDFGTTTLATLQTYADIIKCASFVIDYGGSDEIVAH